MSEKRFNQDSVVYENVVGNVTGNLTGNVTGNVTGDLTGNVTGNVTGDVTGNADTASSASTVFVNDNSLTISATPDGGTFTISGTVAHSYEIYTPGLNTLSLVTIHFLCATATGSAADIFPLVIGFGGGTAINYTEVLCNVTTSSSSRTLSGVIDVGNSDITITDSNGLNPAAGQNWSIVFYYLT